MCILVCNLTLQIQMRPFFSYFGSRWSISRHYFEPNKLAVIEPFAGSAGYSTRWGVDKVILIDKSPDVCAVWDFLINATSADIDNLPDAPESVKCLDGLPLGAKNLILFWTNKARATLPTSFSPWYFKYRSTPQCLVWNECVKTRIKAQVPKIKNWEIYCTDYTTVKDFVDSNIHVHIDPPFAREGYKYAHSEINYEALSAFCQSLNGFHSVGVCENAEATWLPFQPVSVMKKAVKSSTSIEGYYYRTF